MFKEARSYKKCIIFIDEIDSLGYERNKQSLCKEADNTLNQLLSEMDGFQESKGITVIGATNQPDILDKALLRPGRFDRKIKINLPEKAERCDILNIHLSKRMTDVTQEGVQEVAEITKNFSGSELENIVNEASFAAYRRARKNIRQGKIRNDDIKE
mmetsp:Transcript_22918/g.22772  ORF Transcript_22918/g.22772 Transcript_22918/m.22772 type:complete len:157 (+) Transcript_22918:724-1194(+)